MSGLAAIGAAVREAVDKELELRKAIGGQWADIIKEDVAACKPAPRPSSAPDAPKDDEDAFYEPGTDERQ